MGKRSFWKVAVALAVVATGVLSAHAAHADLNGLVASFAPAGTLVMPFDVTKNKASFEIVTRVEGNQGSRPVATHWSFWASDCKHQFDFFVCLTPNDTVVVDPTALQSEVQVNNPPANVKVGGRADLSGKKGMVTVTAFAADVGPSGRECRVIDPAATLEDVLIGGWTIANTTTNAAFGGDAIGLSSRGVLPDAGLLSSAGVHIQTFNPQSLTDSDVILLPVQFPGGSGAFEQTELGPITSTITCDTGFVDDLEIETSLPDLRFKCAAFNPISANTAAEGEVPIIPPATTIDSPGYIHLTSCRTSKGLLGEGKFLFAFHGQAVGPFGTAVRGKYTRERFG